MAGENKTNKADRIGDIIETYQNVGDTLNLAMLQDMRRELVCLSYDFAKGVGTAKINYNYAYTSRKLFYAKKVENIRSTQGVTGAEAERKAASEQEYIELVKKENECEGRFEKGKIMLNAIRDILSAMLQDISILKSEKNEAAYLEDVPFPDKEYR